jgi:hypothetical protein
MLSCTFLLASESRGVVKVEVYWQYRAKSRRTQSHRGGGVGPNVGCRVARRFAFQNCSVELNLGLSAGAGAGAILVQPSLKHNRDRPGT